MLNCLIEFLFGIFLWFKYPGWVCGMDFGLGFCKQFQGGFLLACFRLVEKCCGKLVLSGVLLGGLAVEKYFGGGLGMGWGFQGSVLVYYPYTNPRGSSPNLVIRPPIFDKIVILTN